MSRESTTFMISGGRGFIDTVLNSAFLIPFWGINVLSHGGHS